MGWATRYIEQLKQGKTVSFRPHGNSMTPYVESGELVVVVPPKEIKVGDIVLCKVNGNEYLHFVKAIKDNRYQIGNARGHINGWTNQVYGVKV